MDNCSKNYGFVFALWTLFCVGCGDISVSGKVTLTDGSPVTKGKVYFENGSFSATGDIQKDGSYQMGTTKKGNGIPPGTYKVAIMGAFVNTFNNDDNKPNKAGVGGLVTHKPVLFQEMVHKKYTSVSTSGLTVDVQKSMKHDIVLEPPAK